ncbi:MAG: CDP-alcohol phosphatidyltransferase family protein [Candidatus Omnitrophica bacterium]|nr:CDP-alcohol phosphatidyltransferase family protein [Candidatus Omnitrophota bacterium]
MNLANSLTLSRILLVPVFITLIAYYDGTNEFFRYAALGVFSLCCLTDAIDGYVARVFHQRTAIGTLLDPVADKLLLVSAFISIFLQGTFYLKPPIWVVIVITSRDALIILGLLILFFTTGKITAMPNLLGKATTVCQMLTVILLLFQNSIVPIFWYLTATLTILSGAVYIIREGRRLREITLS